MKQFKITLTESEIEALKLCLCHVERDYNKEADFLRDYNKTGINTKLIEAKRERANECYKLWEKLYVCSNID